MHNKISYMEEKCRHKNLKQQIIKCLNCFPNSKIVQPSLHFLCQGICKPILCREQTFILGKFPQGLGTVFPLSIYVAFCCKYILSICMKYMDQFVN